MKINEDDMKLYGRVSPQLAAKLQPLIVEAMEASGMERNLIQSALLKHLETTPARIGLATAKRLLKDPKGMVDTYQEMVASDEAAHQNRFDKDLRAMVTRLTQGVPEGTMEELASRFPGNRNFREMQTAAKLHVENKGRPLTVVPLSEKVYKNGGPPLPAEAFARLVDGKLVLIDGEAAGFIARDSDGELILARGPCPKEELKGSFAHVEESPGRPQMEFAMG